MNSKHRYEIQLHVPVLSSHRKPQPDSPGRIKYLYLEIHRPSDMTYDL
jgi:hypothetical protein